MTCHFEYEYTEIVNMSIHTLSYQHTHGNMFKKNYTRSTAVVLVDGRGSTLFLVSVQIRLSRWSPAIVQT